MNRYQLAYYISMFFFVLLLIGIFGAIIASGAVGLQKGGAGGALLAAGGALIGSAIPFLIYGTLVFALRDWKKCELGAKVWDVKQAQELAQSQQQLNSLASAQM